MARRYSSGIGYATIALAPAMLLLAAMLALAGFDVGASLAALWRGAFGSTDAVLSSTLVRAVPLVIIGCGMVVALRAGVINVGGDGQLLAGATAAAAVAGSMPPGAIAAVVALLAAALAGAGWSALPAWLRVRYGTLEVVSTIMMNFVALHAVGYLVRGPLQEPSGIYPQSAAVEAATRLPLLVSGTRLHAGALVALAVGFLTWVVLARTAAGFRILAVGSNPRAAHLAGGIDVGRVGIGAFLASGALAGLAGGVELLGVTYALYENLSPGYGYTAIAVALLARLKPLPVVSAAVLLGALAAGAAAMQREAGVPFGATATVEAMLVIAVLCTQVVLARRVARGA